jgi:hypothetical protein
MSYQWVWFAKHAVVLQHYGNESNRPGSDNNSLSVLYLYVSLMVLVLVGWITGWTTGSS